MELLLQRMLPRFAEILTRYLRRNQYHYLFLGCCAEYSYAYQKYSFAELLRNNFESQSKYIVPCLPTNSPINFAPSLIQFFIEQTANEVLQQKGKHNLGRLDGILQALQESTSLMIALKKSFPARLWHKDSAYKDSVLFIYEYIICLQFDLTLEKYSGVDASRMQVFYLDSELICDNGANTEQSTREVLLEGLKELLPQDRVLTPDLICSIVNFLNDEFTVLYRRNAQFPRALEQLRSRQDYKKMVSESLALERASNDGLSAVDCTAYSDEELLSLSELGMKTPSVVEGIDTPELECLTERGGIMVTGYAANLAAMAKHDEVPTASGSGASAHGAQICRPSAPSPGMSV